MNSILLIRDALRSVYSRYGNVILPILKVVIAFLMLAFIQNSIGYNQTLSRPVVIGAASLICAFFPFGVITFVSAIFVLANMFEVSVMMAVFSAVMYVLILVLYYGYKPGTGIIIGLVPLMFYLKLPFIVPLILGLCCGMSSSIAAVLGVLCWNIIHYFAQNAESLSQAGAAEISDEIIIITKTILTNEYMYLVMFSFVLCIAMVSVISRSSLNHCWVISVSLGTVILAICMVLGGAFLGEGSFVADIIGLLVSLLLALFYVVVIYSVDFNRTENFSYEDDDYYYYVKAVPKINPYDGNGGL